MSITISRSELINMLPYNSPYRFMNNGEGYQKLNNTIYMSVYYFKYLHDIEGNTHEQNADDSSRIYHLCDYVIKTNSKKFEYVNLYPVKDLDEFYNVDSTSKLKEYKLI